MKRAAVRRDPRLASYSRGVESAASSSSTRTVADPQYALENRPSTSGEVIEGTLNMLVGLAERYASYDDDLVRLDRVLATIFSRVGDYCAEVRKASQNRNEQKRVNNNVYLRATLFVFESYKDEITDGKLSTDCFPRTSLQKLDRHRAVNRRPSKKIARRMTPPQRSEVRAILRRCCRPTRAALHDPRDLQTGLARARTLSMRMPSLMATRLPTACKIVDCYLFATNDWMTHRFLSRRTRGDAMLEALQINFALWGMIICLAIKASQYTF